MYGESYPKRGSIAVSEKVEVCGGGVGANMAVALARLNAEVRLTGAVGKDPWGDFIFKEMRREGINLTLVQVRENELTGFMFIFVDKEGERTILGSRGANKNFRATDEVLEAVSEVSHVHVSGYSLMDPEEFPHAVSLLRTAKKSDVTTSVDMEGIAFQRKENILQLKGLMDYCTLNEIEAESLCKEFDNKGIEDIRRRLDAEIFVVKRGKRGCLVIWDDGRRLIPAKRVKVEDTTGAGDAFNAGFLFGISKGLSPIEACELGNAVAGYKCEGKGAWHLPRLKQLVERWPDLRSFLPV